MQVEALRKYREEKLARRFNVPLPFPQPAIPGSLQMCAAINRKRTAKSAAYRAEQTAAAMRAIANHLSGVPGRKSAIWIASEVPGAAAGLAERGDGDLIR
jgi:hypothetical protein